MVEIGQDIGLGREFFGPVPFLLQILVERIGILHAFDIAARTGIAVPVPGPAHIVAAFEHSRGKTKLAQAFEEIQPGKAGADDNGVDRARCNTGL